MALCVDDCTSKHSRLSYSRLQVEVDVKKLVPSTIQIVGVDGQLFFQQKVFVEWIPMYCRKLRGLGTIVRKINLGLCRNGCQMILVLLRFSLQFLGYT